MTQGNIIDVLYILTGKISTFFDNTNLFPNILYLGQKELALFQENNLIEIWEENFAIIPEETESELKVGYDSIFEDE